MAVFKSQRWQRIIAILLFLMPSLITGVAVGVYPGYKLYEHVWYDAKFCVTCHVHDYASVGWEQSVHGEKTTCHDCHHQRLRDYFREAAMMVVAPPTFPRDLHHTPYVDKNLCAACHVSNAADRSTITGPLKYEDIEKIPKVDLSHLHSVHLKKTTDLTLLNSHQHTDNERLLEGLRPNVELNRTKGPERDIGCADCHGGPANRGHNFAAVDAVCVRCHSDQHRSEVTKTFGCRNCHFQQFLIPVKKIEDHSPGGGGGGGGGLNH
jgi:hypothetical protein